MYDSTFKAAVVGLNSVRREILSSFMKPVNSSVLYFTACSSAF